MRIHARFDEPETIEALRALVVDNLDSFDCAHVAARWLERGYAGDLPLWAGIRAVLERMPERLRKAGWEGVYAHLVARPELSRSMVRTIASRSLVVDQSGMLKDFTPARFGEFMAILEQGRNRRTSGVS